MSHNKVANVSVEVSLDIFSSPLIKQTADELLNLKKYEIISKIDTTTRAIRSYDPLFEVDEERVFEYFANNFFEDVLTKAITMCLKGEHDYNMVKCIISLLTKENLIEAVSGNSISNAYSKAVSELTE